MSHPPVEQRGAWRALADHADEIGQRHLRDFFTDQQGRFATFSRQAAGLTLDLSKQRWNETTLSLLLELARDAGVPNAIRGLLAGERLNLSENRPALHTALRLPADARLDVRARIW